MPQLPTPTTIEERDAQIMKYLEQALAYMKTGDVAKGPVAHMYAEFIIETFEAEVSR
jgi:hypothetical protein